MVETVLMNDDATKILFSTKFDSYEHRDEFIL